MRQIVVPGELITSEPKRLGEHVFAKDGKIFSDALGLGNSEGPVAFVVPLRGRYIPRNDDLIVGVVAQIVHSGALVDINSFYLAFVSNKELRDPLQIGSIVSAKIMNVSETKDVDLGFVRVFYGGEIVRVPPVKVPRMIGKNSSMLDVLKAGTQSNIMIGRNGLVWAKGGNTTLLRAALGKIDKEAHLDHLTDAIAVFLKEHAASSPAAAAEKPEKKDNDFNGGN